MTYISLDYETHDPTLKDKGKVKARGTSCVFGLGRVIVAGFYDGSRKWSIDGEGGDYVRSLLLSPDVTIIGANIQYDAVWAITSLGLDPKDVRCRYIDVSVAESLIDEYQKYDLDSLAWKYLRERKGKSVLEDICAARGLKGDFRGHLAELWDDGYRQEIRDYVMSDADQPWRIWEQQKRIIEGEGLMRAFQMNMDMLRVTVFMKVRGVRFDLGRWLANCRTAGDAYARLRDEYEGKYGQVNINSSKQLAVQMDKFDVPYKCKLTFKGWKPEGRKFTKEDLFEGDELTRQKKTLREIFNGVTLEKGKIVLYVPKRYASRTWEQAAAMGYEVLCNPCVNKAMFTELSETYPIVADLAQYKQAKNIVDKFLGPAFGRFIVAHYADGKVSPAFGDDGAFLGEGAVEYRIHSTYNVVGARQTGRMSSSQCNNQQIPSKTVLFAKTDHELDLARLCRECFVAAPRHAFVKQDYAAQENRLAAYFAPGPNGERIRQMYRDNPFLDEHSYVTEVSGLAEQYGAKAGRKFAKNLRFGVCLSSDSLYATADGVCSGKELVGGGKPLLGLDGQVQGYTAHLFHSDGLEFELSNGVKFVSTPGHLFLDCESVDKKVKPAVEMRVGDRVPLARTAPSAASGTRFFEGVPFDNGFAYLAGLYLGDGCIQAGVSLITHKKNTGFVTGLLDDYRLDWSVRHEKVVDRVYIKKTGNAGVVSFFRLFGEGCDNKLIPDFVYTASREEQLWFLAGLIDSDGCITDYSARIMGCNERLIRGAARLCAIIGMNCRFGVCRHKEADKKDEFVLDIHDTAGLRIPTVYRTGCWKQNPDYLGWAIPASQLERFRTPGLYRTNVRLYDFLRGKNGLYAHNSWLPDGVWQKGYAPVEIVAIRHVPDAEFTYLTTDSHYYIADGFATHNCYGMQIARMMIQFGWDKEFAEDLYDKVASAAPWLFELMDKVQETVLRRRYITTLAGRRVHMRRGHDKDAYKYMNYLIQGSAADMTKTATNAVYDGMLAEYDEHGSSPDEIVLSVHDEDDFDVDCTDVERAVSRIMEIRRSMEDTSGCDLPIVSCPEIGTSWADGIEWDPSLGDCEDFVRRACTAIRDGRFGELREQVKAWQHREEDDGMSFSEFCAQVDEDEDDDEAVVF